MEKRWLVKEKPTDEKLGQLAGKLNIEPVLATLLVQRGIESFDEARHFFRPQLEMLHDPFLMKNMDRALDRLEHAIQQQEKVLLFGDYDVDGTTAVALLYNLLKPYLPELDFYIPDRYAEGYGISFKGIDHAKANGQRLVIALDCGIKAHEKVDYAKAAGIDFIICDHHEPGDTIPDAIVLDQKQSDCLYPYKELSGCGVGFKLMQAFFEKRGLDKTPLYQNLDLLTLSIAADIVPVTGENRILSYFGLELINKRPRKGVLALLKQAKKELPLTLTNVVFVLAPRINAAGRIHEGKKAVQLLISEDQKELNSLAASIEQDNFERRALDEQITNEALQQIEGDSAFAGRKTTVVFNENWHKGVIGIVASRLIENHYKPTIVLTESNGKITGSARSITGLNIHDALEKCRIHLEQFGGHAYAAGMTLEKHQLEAFCARFEEVVQSSLPDSELVPEQQVDYHLSFSEIYTTGENVYEIPKFKRILNQLEPHGPGNMKPVFVSRNVFAEDVRVLKDVHLKLVLSQPDTGLEMQGIAFNMAHKLDLLTSKNPVDILYTLETNAWNNKESLQLNIKDIRSTI
ncbi:MAG: single-stranded-DNA-specific exonuclease RecJ [Crocinitomicaceae bacterium]|jgi:single-stranded-DNA-specific exonuclease|nr:single-stranded-DNA-specific exonuclease RecJ [Crocinitomicaceae bacterium]